MDKEALRLFLETGKLNPRLCNDSRETYKMLTLDGISILGIQNQ